jgi:hypothetical protein
MADRDRNMDEQKDDERLRGIADDEEDEDFDDTDDLDESDEEEDEQEGTF